MRSFYIERICKFIFIKNKCNLTLYEIKFMKKTFKFVEIYIQFIKIHIIKREKTNPYYKQSKQCSKSQTQ